MSTNHSTRRDDITLIDSQRITLARIYAISDLVNSAPRDELSDDTIPVAAGVILDLAIRAQQDLETWWTTKGGDQDDDEEAQA